MKSKNSINSSICNGKSFYKLYEYNKKPKNEKNFYISGNYKRMFYECKICKHIFAKHYFNITKLYSKQYLDLTYKNESGLNKRFKYIVNLSTKLSENKKRAERINGLFPRKKKKNIIRCWLRFGSVFVRNEKKRLESKWH